MNVYDIPVTTIDGVPTTLEQYRGQVMLIVNVASKCSFTRQYAGLEALYREYKDRGLVVLGFPCNQFMGQEPGASSDIKEFCTSKYDVTFPMFAKLDVNGANTHPLYQYLKSQKRGLFWTRSIKWNFTKFLLGRDGTVVRRYGMFARPSGLKQDIEKLLKAEAIVYG